MQISVEFIFSGMQPSPPAEAAARRRIRSLQHAHPAVTSWQVRVQAPPREPAHAEAFAVHLRAQCSGGNVAHSAASASELLGALRLAFNAIEADLATACAGGRRRTGGWLQALRSRFAPSSFG